MEKQLLKGIKMKFLWMIPCLVLCACVNSREPANNAYYQETAYALAPVEVASAVSANPYALEPPAYEQNENQALKQKEDELFQKEKFLLESQQELYEREKKLASREAEFINRSKALDYKEQSIVNGHSYAPMVPPVPVYHSASVQQPVIAPVVQPVAARPLPPEPVAVEESIVFNAVSEPASYEVADAGFIIMQHPIQRDLVRCPVSDDVCLQSYERLGYVRSNNLSRFTVQDELNTAGTYPTNAVGQWRENNSVPRW